MNRRRIRRSGFEVLNAFLIGTLLLRALIPVGYMPADRGWGVKLCTAAGIVESVKSPANREAPPQADEHRDVTCAFAAVPGAVPVPASAVFASVSIKLLAVAIADGQSVALPTIELAQFPRGPPRIT